MTFTHGRAFLLAGAGLIAFYGVALADDHLATATDHGLSEDSQPFQTNKAGHSGDLAPGQGSPFAGEDRKTPATDTAAANNNANVQDPKTNPGHPTNSP
jgi:hypothetical protein